MTRGKNKFQQLVSGSIESLWQSARKPGILSCRAALVIVVLAYIGVLAMRLSYRKPVIGDEVEYYLFHRETNSYQINQNKKYTTAMVKTKQIRKHENEKYMAKN